jgi:hypothetical protein
MGVIDYQRNFGADGARTVIRYGKRKKRSGRGIGGISPLLKHGNARRDGPGATGSHDPAFSRGFPANLCSLSNSTNS